jgi:hypothetical protein
MGADESARPSEEDSRRIFPFLRGALGIDQRVDDPHKGGVVRWLGLALLFWLLSWVVVGLARIRRFVPSNAESVAVGAALGAIVICAFIGLYLHAREEDGRIRQALAGSFLIFYLVLCIDLLVIGDFRTSLSGKGGFDPVAKTILKTLGGFGTAIIGFYFAASGTEKVVSKVQTAKTERETVKAESAKEIAKYQYAGSNVAPD